MATKTVYAALQELVDLEPKPKETAQAFLARLVGKVDAHCETAPDDWETLGWENENAQTWVNEAVDAVKAKTPIPVPEGFDESLFDAKVPDSTKAANEPPAEDQMKRKSKSASNKKKPVKKAKKAADVKARGDGYKGHRAGSRKEQAHKLFDELGPDAAKEKILALGISKATLPSWFQSFREAA